MRSGARYTLNLWFCARGKSGLRAMALDKALQAGAITKRQQRRAAAVMAALAAETAAVDEADEMAAPRRPPKKPAVCLEIYQYRFDR